MNICAVSEGLNNPAWSSASFFAHAIANLKNVNGVAVKHTGKIPMYMDWYIDIDSARDLAVNRDRFRPVCFLVREISNAKKSWRVKHAKTADKVCVTNERDQRILTENGIDSQLITFGIQEDIWKPDSNVKKEFDSMFIGDLGRETSRHRSEYINRIKKDGFDIRHSHKKKFLEDNALALNKSRIGLEINDKKNNTFHMRTMEIIGCGLPLLIQRLPLIEKIIPKGLATYYDVDGEDLVERYREVYDNIEEKRERAMELREYFLSKFTYSKIAENIIRILDGSYDQSELFYGGQ